MHSICGYLISELYDSDAMISLKAKRKYEFNVSALFQGFAPCTGINCCSDCG